MSRPYLALSLFTLVVGACAAIVPVPYAPQPARIADPVAETKSLIDANTTAGCVTESTIKGAVLAVKFVCSNGIGNTVVRLDHIASIELQQSGEWYRLLVHHDNGADDFAWTSKRLEDMQRLDDALTALSHAHVAKS